MKTKTIKLAALVAISFGIAVASCKKNTTSPTNPTSTDSDVSSANNNSMAEQNSSDIMAMTSEGSENMSGTSSSFNSYRVGGGAESVSALSCANVSVNVLTKVFTATFNGGICLDGKIRSGTLTFDYSASPSGSTAYRNPGFTCTVTSSGYVVDGTLIKVHKIITNTTQNPVPASTNLTWSITATDTFILASGGGTFTWHCNRVKTLLNTYVVYANTTIANDSIAYHGQSSPIKWSNAIIQISGTSNGIDTKGEAYTTAITTSLIKNMMCSPSSLYPGRHPFVMGVFTFTPGTKATRTFDYGNGSCDLNAVVFINGISYAITL